MSTIRSSKALGSLRKRINFARIPTVVDIPNLVEIQRKSFESFIQWDQKPLHRKLQGLEGVFQDVFPISDLNTNARIEFVGYEVEYGSAVAGNIKSWAGPVWSARSASRK